MIVALYQCMEPTSIEDGLSVLDTALSQAAAKNVDMLVLPETFLPGYTQVTTKPPDDWTGVRGKIAALCAQYGMALTIGLPVYSGSAVFNTAQAFSADGSELACYTKRQLFGPDEAALYTSGDRDVVFDYRGICFGLLICYDVEFPEHVRSLARLGAEVILVPTANMMPFTNVNEIMVPSRAAENAVTIVYANYCATADSLTYTGLSRIVGPDGYVMACQDDGTGLCLANLPEPKQSKRGIPLATQLRDYKRH